MSDQNHKTQSITQLQFGRPPTISWPKYPQTLLNDPTQDIAQAGFCYIANQLLKREDFCLRINQTQHKSISALRSRCTHRSKTIFQNVKNFHFFFWIQQMIFYFSTKSFAQKRHFSWAVQRRRIPVFQNVFSQRIFYADIKYHDVYPKFYLIFLLTF